MKNTQLLLVVSLTSVLYACGGGSGNTPKYSSSSSVAVSSSSVAVSSSSVAVSSSSVAVSSNSVATTSSSSSATTTSSSESSSSESSSSESSSSMASSSTATVTVPAPQGEWKFASLDFPTTSLVESGLTITDNLSSGSTSAGRSTFTATSGKAAVANTAISMNPTPTTAQNYAIVRGGSYYDYGLPNANGLALEMVIQPAAFPPESSNATLIAVAKSESTSTSAPSAGCAWNEGAGYSLTLANDGTMRFAINKDTTTSGVVSSTTPLTVNNWYHIVATYDKSEMKIYINGTLEATTAYTENLVSPVATGATAGPGFLSNCANFRAFGTTTSAAGTTYNFQGTVDELRLYNVGLSAEQVTARWALFN